jgi:hypothetical protein
MLHHGIQEFHIWGKAEIEDQLFLPQNDHLLFAYFNISLQVRRESARALIRSRLSLKRKLVKALGDVHQQGHRVVLIRDPQHENYPYIKNPKDFIIQPLWRYWGFDSHQPPDHVAFVSRQYLAYVNWETQEWDILAGADIAIPFHPALFGLDRESWDPDDKADIYNAYWNRHVPEAHRAWAMELRFIHYDRIIAFDDIGDHYNEGPHLLVDYSPTNGPFERSAHRFLKSARPYDGRGVLPDEKLRVSFFPKEMPDEREAYQQELLENLDKSRRQPS